MFPVLALVLMSQQPVIPVMEGVASYYTVASSSTLTASGETFTDDLLTCAMLTGKFGTFYRVTADNGRMVIVKLNDRGPYIENRVIDLSQAAMERLDPGLIDGVLNVSIERMPEAELAQIFDVPLIW